MSGPVVICLDVQTPVDRALLRCWLHTDYYKEKREANYRHLRRKIIVEEFFRGTDAHRREATRYSAGSAVRGSYRWTRTGFAIIPERI